MATSMALAGLHAPTASALAAPRRRTAGSRCHIQTHVAEKDVPGEADISRAGAGGLLQRCQRQRRRRARALSVVPSAAAAAAADASIAEMAERRAKARPVAPGGTYPAKEHCSQCGLCDTPYIAHVKEACAFLGDGMARLETLEPAVHGRGRDLTNDEMRLGVVDEAGPNTSTRFSLTFTKLFVPPGGTL